MDKSIRDYLAEDVILKNSLDGVTKHLTRELEIPAMIVDRCGKIHGPSRAQKHEMFASPDEAYLIIPEVGWSDSGYLIDPEGKRFYYKVGEETVFGYVVLCGFQQETTEKALTTLKQCTLALKIYLSKLQEVNQVQDRYKDELIHGILYENVSSIKELIRESTQRLNFAQVYYVCIFEPEEKVDIHFLYSYSKDWLIHNKLDIICSIWEDNTLVFICPSHFQSNTLEVDYGWNRHLSNINRYHKEINHKFNISSKMGIGKKYPIMMLFKSFQEAKIALSFPQLLGERNYVKHFVELGIFTLLFSHKNDILKDFIESKLTKLIEHDKKQDGDLLSTLRILFNNGMNWKVTANQLFIHVNTLRYRIHKINELLDVDLSKLHSQLDLYVALILMDTLVASKYYENKGILQYKERNTDELDQEKCDLVDL